MNFFLVVTCHQPNYFTGSMTALFLLINFIFILFLLPFLQIKLGCVCIINVCVCPQCNELSSMGSLNPNDCAVILAGI